MGKSPGKILLKGVLSLFVTEYWMVMARNFELAGCLHKICFFVLSFFFFFFFFIKHTSQHTSRSSSTGGGRGSVRVSVCVCVCMCVCVCGSPPPPFFFFLGGGGGAMRQYHFLKMTYNVMRVCVKSKIVSPVIVATYLIPIFYVQ